MTATRWEVRMVRAPNPGPLTGPGTNTWVLGAGESLVVDPGPDHEGHLRQVAARAEEVGRLVAVAVTHRHRDHLEGARHLCQMTGAPLARHHLEVEASGELPLHDGDRILVGRAQVEVLETPGHSPDHLCLHLPEAGLLLTGDHVLQGSTTMVNPPEGDMAAYLGSLRRLLELRPRRLLPGHGEPIEDGPPALEALLQHRLQREAQVLEQLAGGPAAPEELVPRLYAGYPEAVLPLARGTLLAHLLKLEREGRVRRLGTGQPTRFELS